MDGTGVNRRRLIGLALAALLALPGGARAEDSGGHDGGHDGAGDHGGDNAGANHGDDQGAARKAVTNGKAVSLREVLNAVDHRIGGEVVDVKLVNVQGDLLYHLKIIDPQGRLVEVSVNALTKEIRKVKGF